MDIRFLDQKTKTANDDVNDGYSLWLSVWFSTIAILTWKMSSKYCLLDRKPTLIDAIDSRCCRGQRSSPTGVRRTACERSIYHMVHILYDVCIVYVLERFTITSMCVCVRLWHIILHESSCFPPVMQCVISNERTAGHTHTNGTKIKHLFISTAYTLVKQK